jgi:RNA polymerase sigma-70 factor (ECF subfamily)
MRSVNEVRAEQFVEPADAEDLTQGFLQSLLEREAFQHADPVRGRLRCYLLACLNHYLHSQTDRQGRQKRGGGIPHISLDAVAAEERYRLEPVERYTPEQLFERRWAMTVIETALDRLREETSQGGRAELCLELKNAIVGDPSRLPYAEIADRLGISEGAVAVLVHRWRRRYRDLCRAEVALTVLDPAEVEAEMQHLLRVLRD